MKIAIVGGGTLGHIVPGLILGSNLAKKHEIIYITTKKDKRFNIFNKHKYLKKVYYIDSNGLSKNILTNIMNQIDEFNSKSDTFRRESVSRNINQCKILR